MFTPGSNVNAHLVLTIDVDGWQPPTSHCYARDKHLYN